MAKREAQAHSLAPAPDSAELKLVVSRETAEVEALATADAAPQPGAIRTRNPARERLYADIGGAVIGLSVAAAVINFVLLK